MSATSSSSPFGWIARGRGLRRSKQLFRALSEYELWVSDHDADEEAVERPARRERTRQLRRDPSLRSSSFRWLRAEDRGAG